MAIFGSNQSALETVLLKRRVMMPCWLSLKHPTRIDTSAQVHMPATSAVPAAETSTDICYHQGGSLGISKPSLHRLAKWQCICSILEDAAHICGSLDFLGIVAQDCGPSERSVAQLTDWGKAPAAVSASSDAMSTGLARSVGKLPSPFSCKGCCAQDRSHAQ